MTAPGAPWRLQGEAIVTFARAPGLRQPGRAPTSRRLPGPVLVGAVRYTNTPVGPYLEFAVGEPAWLRNRPGFAITTMVVDSPASRLGGRANWGFPKEMGLLRWTTDGLERELRWSDRDITVHATTSGRRGMPAWVPVHAIQPMPDGDAIVPGRLWGWLTPARVQIDVPSGDPLAPIAGHHTGALLSSFGFVVGPARIPAAPVLAPTPLAEPT